jgi:class 3 adenylate cyclase
MFWFPTALDAVAAAVQLLHDVPAAGLPPAHVGVAAGPVIAQDGDYYGRTVNLAARLAGHAGPDQVLIADEVARLMGDAIEVSSLGRVELKGIPHPVTIHEVIA